MADQIRLDYAATMTAAQGLTSVSDLVKDAQARQGAVSAGLGSWEGAAATKAKILLANVTDVLAGYDTSYWQLARYFVNAAEQLTASDEAAASAIEATWDGAYDPGSARS